MQIYQKTIFILSKAFHFVFTKTLDLKVSLIWFIDKKKEKKKNCQLSSLAQASMSNQLANQAYLLLKKKSDSFCNSKEHVF